MLLLVRSTNLSQSAIVCGPSHEIALLRKQAVNQWVAWERLFPLPRSAKFYFLRQNNSACMSFFLAMNYLFPFFFNVTIDYYICCTKSCGYWGFKFVLIFSRRFLLIFCKVVQSSLFWWCIPKYNTLWSLLRRHSLGKKQIWRC